MFESSILKVNRASEHIRELIKLFKQNRAFSYILETNTQTGERATFAKKNESVIDAGALICGDIVHNLRSALDHAFWEVVSPFANTEKERRDVQFPFCKSEADLDGAMKQKLAHRVSQRFFDAIKGLRPYRDAGGNEFLWLVHELNLTDKHRLLTPTADYTHVTGSIIKDQIPDFPLSGTMIVGQNRGDFVWRSAGPFHLTALGKARPATRHIFEREIDIPVDIVFRVGSPQNPRPVIQTINRMRNATQDAVGSMREAFG